MCLFLSLSSPQPSSPPRLLSPPLPTEGISTVRYTLNGSHLTDPQSVSVPTAVTATSAEEERVPMGGRDGGGGRGGRGEKGREREREREREGKRKRVMICMG